ncbi:MAG TPA: S-layer homology domain-containing protein [Chloroflexia bacterium]|nr:S-layer homology domain-containing protein [Chloroflexia bacterium]
MTRTFRRIAGVVLVAFALLGISVAGKSALNANAAYPTESNAAQGRVPTVSYPVRSDASPPLRSIQPIQPEYGQVGDFPLHPVNKDGAQGQQGTDSALEKLLSPLVMPTPIANFEGIYNIWGGYPPDTSGDVGPNHYLQIVNVGFQIFNKTGTSLYGPANNNTLFRNFGGFCESTNRGDPVGLYDPLADRWLVSWFAFTNSNGPTHQCFAISATPDPLGVWYRYDFLVGNNFEDYPHVGVWSDAYYMATNTFGGPGGGANYAFERDLMLQGDPNARMVVFRVTSSGILPSDLDGTTPPPAGSPNYFMEWFSTTNLGFYKFHVDWANTANSTFTGPVMVPVTAFSSSVPGITQPGTSATLATLSDRLMYRVAYRNLGTHESIVVNHTVNTGGFGSIRWYELRDPNNATPTLFQQGTYAPGDSVHRWMGSIAMDHAGNIAAGFSASSTTVYPSIRYAGRLASDPAGTFAQGEAELIAGTGSQTGPGGRWGDYSQMNVDPVDDCTFWYTTEYIQVTGERTWRTRIGSFKFPSCTPVTRTPVPTATGAVPSPTVPLASPTACASSASYTGSITNTDLAQISRIITVGLPPSTCDIPRACPGQDSSVTDQHNYDSYTYQNMTGSSQCVTVTLNPGCSNNALTSVAYLGTYDPNNKCTNYIADGARGGPNNVYSFTLGAGQTAVVIVFEHNGGIGCETYTLRINPCGTGGATATVAPTMTAVPATSTATVPAATSTPIAPTSTVPPTQTPGGATATTAPTNTLVPTVVLPSSTSTAVATMTQGVATATTEATATPCTISFTDVPPDHTFYSFIRCLACRGIISGYSDGTFQPGNDITRGQIAKMVSNSAGFNEDPGPQIYEDVPPASPFYAWINRLSMRGHMGGYPCGLVPEEPCEPPDNRPYFRPNASATRGQLAKIVANAAGIGGTPTGIFYTDVQEDHPFYVWIMRLTTLGVMSGYPCGTIPEEPCDEANRPYFRPFNNVTRGQASKIVANTFFPGCDTPQR